MDKQDIIMIICAIGIISTTIYLWGVFYAWTRIAWGIWGVCIFFGTIASCKKSQKEEKQ